jgi:signal transduction histidine kinase
MAEDISPLNRVSKAGSTGDAGKDILPRRAGFKLQLSGRSVLEELAPDTEQELALLKTVARRIAYGLPGERQAPNSSILGYLIPGAGRCVVLVYDANTCRLHPEVTVNLPEEFLPVLAYNEEKRRLLTMAIEQADPFLLIYLPGNKQFSFLWRLAHREDISALWLVPWCDRDGSLIGALLFALSQAFPPDKQALASITLATEWMTMALQEERARLDNVKLKASTTNHAEAGKLLNAIGGMMADDRYLEELTGWHRAQTKGKPLAREQRKPTGPDVISVLSHELLSPLTLIKGYAATLLQLGEAITEEQKRQYIRSIESAGNKLTSLLENFRDLSRLEAGTPNLVRELTSLPDLLRKTISNMQDQTTKHVLKLYLARPLPRVNVDRHKIEQLMTNLLSNAIKYSPQGGDIEVSVRHVRDEEELRESLGLGNETKTELPCLIVTISDTGIGIPDEDLENVFQKFYRANNRLTSTTSGAGLGLYICKIIVEAHGGNIWADSKIDKGSTFRFSIPVV